MKKEISKETAKETVKETKKKVAVKPSVEERYTENGEDKIKTTYPSGAVIVTTL